MKQFDPFSKYKLITNINQRNAWQLFILYTCVILYAVFLTPNRFEGVRTIPNLSPLINNIKRFQKPAHEHFWSYYINFWGNIIGNILLFIPFGFLLGCLCRKSKSWCIILTGSAISCLIEGVQFLLQIGVGDIDDVIFNTVGVVIGIHMYNKFKSQTAKEI